VLVHVDVGTANAANAMHNMLRTRIPVLLMAGKAPFTTANELTGSRDTYVHFIQEPFDQASLVRPYVKWEWTLPSGVVAKEALRRAHAIMHAEPQGPVYLMMHRETLTQELNEADIRGGAVSGCRIQQDRRSLRHPRRKAHRPRRRSRCTPPLRRCRPRRSWCTAARAGHTDLSANPHLGRAVALSTANEVIEIDRR
jgi:hypothetical protein